jgi:Beta-lactamase superfamily domain
LRRSVDVAGGAAGRMNRIGSSRRGCSSSPLTATPAIVLALVPDSATWNQIGTALRSLGRFDEAVHRFRHVPFEIQGIPIVPFAQDHGFSTTLGLRIGGFAYSTDVIALDDAAFAAIEGIELWIVDCLRRAPHPTHSHLERTLSWIARVRPRRAVLTHMDQSMDYRELSAELPCGVEPGCDGLVIEILDPCRAILQVVSSEGASGCFVRTNGPPVTGLC